MWLAQRLGPMCDTYVCPWTLSHRHVVLCSGQAELCEHAVARSFWGMKPATKGYALLVNIQFLVQAMKTNTKIAGCVQVSQIRCNSNPKVLNTIKAYVRLRPEAQCVLSPDNSSLNAVLLNHN